ncbi:MAG TPA: dephospho-CoA kinase [Phycisphaerales bacterium]
MHNASSTPQVFVIRPSAAAIVLRPMPLLVFGVVVFVSAWWLAPGAIATSLMVGAFLLVVGRTIWEIIWRACARYELTPTHLRTTHGVFSRFSVEIALARVQHSVLSKRLTERLAGVGTLGFASAGTDLVEAVWVSVDEPEQVLDRVRAAIAHASAGTSKRAIVLGLVGGIGSGKSAVAKAFAAHGALVLDSDTQAKEALRREDVRRSLVSWWGDGVLDASGQVDRKKVADIVFGDPAQRKKLEELVHPIVRASRATVLAQAAAKGVDLAIIDAPLLLEAGVDRECDAVVFVEAPRQQRLARVQGRGWDEAELDRREAAQWSLDEKKRRSRYVVRNDSDLPTLDRQVAELVARVRQELGCQAASAL